MGRKHTPEDRVKISVCMRESYASARYMACRPLTLWTPLKDDTDRKIEAALDRAFNRIFGVQQ